jgi:hypothetical protein
MKHRIPADVERLMWLVAESNDPNAIADFDSRFPEFSSELARRRRMVSDLKGAKASAAVESRIPAFVPRQTQLNPPSRGKWIAGSLALAALAVASYSITTLTTKQPPVLPKVERVNTEPVSPPPTTVYVPPPKKYAPPVENPAPVNPSPNPAIGNQEPRKTLKLSNTSLTAALKMIGEMEGYRVEVAPGFADQQVSIDYDGFTTSDMLKDMGQRFGFTPFDQGDGTIIIVPAVDAGGINPDTSGSNRRIGG